MKKVQYVGENEINLCRFGIIKAGAKMDFYEWEYEAIKDDPDYKYVGPVPSKEEVALAQKVKPAASKFFDLRTIPWENTALYRLLSSRLSKHTLIKVVKAVNAVGGYIPESSSGENRNVLVDKILEAIKSMGWDKYTKEQRMALFSEPQEPEQGSPETDSDSVKAARPRTRKTENNDDNR